MNIVNNIILVATAVTSIATIFYTIRKVDSAINKFWSDFHKYHMYTLKIAILSEELPLIDRIHAGEEYIKLGGNGLIKMKYEELLKQAYKEMKENND